MNQDAKRATGRRGPSERHAIGITRMCLRSGSVQLPFALSGSLPEGELLVHDAEADEPIVLWSEPPRRLAGLAPLFERHEVQVNDQLVLELRGDDLIIAVAKRPRRSRPKVTPSTWASHRDEPRPDAPAQADHDQDAPRSTTAADGESPSAWMDAPTGVPSYGADPGRDARDDPPRRGDAPTSDEDDAARPARPVGPGQVRPPDETTPTPERRAAWARPDEGPYDDPDDDAPRAPRVTVRPASVARSEAAEAGGPPAGATDRRSPDRGARQRSGGGPFAGLMRRARGWFGGDAGPRGDARGPSDDETERETRDWLQGWDVDGDATDTDPDAFDTTPALDAAVAPATSARKRHGGALDEAPAAPLDTPPPPAQRVDEQPTDDLQNAAAARGARHRSDARGDGAANAPAHESMPESMPETMPESARPSTHAPSEAPPSDVADDDADDDAAATAERATTREPTVPAGRPEVLTGASHEPTDETTDEPTDETSDETMPEATVESAEPPASPPARRSAQGTPLFPAPPTDAPDPQAASVNAPAVDGPPERGATLPSGVPIRAERFLGGDLRTRLLRFLTSPEMPLIAKTDLIAKRFDLEPATAQEMLEDIADDPPDGLRLTVVREGAWRIERRSA